MIATLLGLHRSNPSQTRSSPFLTGYPVGPASTSTIGRGMYQQKVENGVSIGLLNERLIMHVCIHGWHKNGQIWLVARR
jgi:hypothetical protein